MTFQRKITLFWVDFAYYLPNIFNNEEAGTHLANLWVCIYEDTLAQFLKIR